MYELKISNVNGITKIENYDELKKAVISELEGYVSFIPQNQVDYKAIKETRAELNKIKKSINDTKINWVKDLTSTLTSQCKELCDLVDAKSKEFDEEAKGYEESILKKEVKPKTAFKITINCKDEEEVSKITKLLDSKKVQYSVKGE